MSIFPIQIHKIYIFYCESDDYVYKYFFSVYKRFDSFERGNPGKLAHKLNYSIRFLGPQYWSQRVCCCCCCHSWEHDKTSSPLCWQHSWMHGFEGYGRVLGDNSWKFCHQKINWLSGVDLVHCRVNQVLLWLKLINSQVPKRH